MRNVLIRLLLMISATQGILIITGHNLLGQLVYIPFIPLYSVQVYRSFIRHRWKSFRASRQKTEETYDDIVRVPKSCIYTNVTVNKHNHPDHSIPEYAIEA